jgi:hypothetical protein
MTSASEIGAGRFLGATHKTRDLVGVLHQVPGFVIHDHFNQHIAREKLSFSRFLLTVLDFNHFFHGHQNAAKLGLHARTVDPLLMLRSTAFSMPE